MRLFKLLPSRYLTTSPSKYSFTKRRRSLEKQEEKERQEQQLWQQEPEYSQEQEPEQERFYIEEEFGATLFNIEVVALADQDALVFEEEREASSEETGETQGIVFSTRRQDIDIRKYGLAHEIREEAVDEERDQEMQERDSEMELRKVANKKFLEDDDYGPSFIDMLCFSSKALPHVTKGFEKEYPVSEAFKLHNKDEPRPFDRLVGGHLYKNHKDDPLGMFVKNSMTKEGVYISSLDIGSRFKWSTDVPLEGMRILSINGLACPSDLEETVDMLKETEGDLKLVAAVVDPPKPIPPLEDDEDQAEEEGSEAPKEESDDQVTSIDGDETTTFSDDKISALTEEKEQGRKSALNEATEETGEDQDSKGEEDDTKGEQEKSLEDLEASKPSLALVREKSTVHYL